MLILPVAASPDGVAKALTLLREVANQRLKVSLVVFGDDHHRRQIASRADVRAEGHPFRRVVWIPDPAVLDNVAEFTMLTQAVALGDEAVAMTLRFQLSSRLRGAQAVSFMKLDLAFARALAGELAP